MLEQQALWETLKAIRKARTDSDEETGLVHRLLPPGDRLFFMVDRARTASTTASTTCSSTTCATSSTSMGTKRSSSRPFLGRRFGWKEGDWFDKIVLSSSMFKAHMPSNYLQNITLLVTEEEQAASARGEPKNS